MSSHCGYDCFSTDHKNVRMSFTFCYMLVRLCAAVVGMQVDGLHALEELVVVCCESLESAEVIECLQCRCLLR